MPRYPENRSAGLGPDRVVDTPPALRRASALHDPVAAWSDHVKAYVSASLGEFRRKPVADHQGAKVVRAGDVPEERLRFPPLLRRLSIMV